MTYTSSGSSSSSDTEVDSCSKSCLESVEARLAHYKKNEAVFEESMNVLKLEVRLTDNDLNEYKMNLEKAEKERDQLKQTLEKFQNSSKSLNDLLESQVIDKFKIGLGYSVSTAASPAVESFVNLSDKSGSDKGYHSVPLPLTGNFIPRKPDLTFMDEIVESENLDVTTVVTPSNEKTFENKGVFNIVESNTVRRECCALINEELVLDEDDLEDPSKQGRKITKIDQDLGISLVQQDAEIHERHEHKPEFDFDVANIPVTTTGAEISTASPEVKTAGDSIKDITAETLVYIRRSATKAKDKGKAKMEESESIMTKTKGNKNKKDLVLK
ncbi:hypothetical protein Tco_0973909 [Tanacetum coccineum]|uniref:Uncharacterized protein n=1 Tax=Tanacetum coccineum TaxID=301880 RepID=A0ABQ5EA44_9ASTR